MKRVLEQASRRWHEILIHAPRQVRREQLPEANDRYRRQREDLRVEFRIEHVILGVDRLRHPSDLRRAPAHRLELVELEEQLRFVGFAHVRVPVHKSNTKPSSWRRVDGVEVMIQQWTRRDNLIHALSRTSRRWLQKMGSIGRCRGARC